MKVTQFPTAMEKHQRGHVTILPPPVNNAGRDIRKILSRFEKDDYILAGIILVLVFEGCDDYILLAALGYLFLMGFSESK